MQELKASYEAAGLKPAQNQLILVQGEAATAKSSPTLYPISDRSSPSVDSVSCVQNPHECDRRSELEAARANGSNGRSMCRRTDLYQIALKRKQDQLRGVFATRSLMIDGKYPFEEMKRIRFNYNAKWQMDVLGGDEPYLFYLTKGKHRIRMTVTLGRTGSAHSDDRIKRSGTECDVSQDLDDHFEQSGSVARLSIGETDSRDDRSIRAAGGNYRIRGRLSAGRSPGRKSDKVAPLFNMVIQLKDMAEHPETVPRRLDTYKINVGRTGHLDSDRAGTAAND